LSLSDHELITRADSAAATAWLKVDALPEPGGPSPGPGPASPLPLPEPSTIIATTWPDIFQHAETRPLQQLTLDANTPTAADMLAAVAQPLGADQIELEVTVSGELKSGGIANFEVRGAKLNCPIKPLEAARTLFNAMTEGMAYGARLTLKFKDSGRMDMKARLEAAAEKAGEDVKPKATFGKPTDPAGARP
jgi:hypothetical protein